MNADPAVPPTLDVEGAPATGDVVVIDIANTDTAPETVGAEAVAPEAVGPGVIATEGTVPHITGPEAAALPAVAAEQVPA